MNKRRLTVAIVLPELGGGGAERVAVEVEEDAACAPHRTCAAGVMMRVCEPTRATAGGRDAIENKTHSCRRLAFDGVRDS